MSSISLFWKSAKWCFQSVYKPVSTESEHFGRSCFIAVSTHVVCQRDLCYRWPGNCLTVTWVSMSVGFNNLYPRGDVNFPLAVPYQRAANFKVDQSVSVVPCFRNADVRPLGILHLKMTNTLAKLHKSVPRGPWIWFYYFSWQFIKYSTSGKSSLDPSGVIVLSYIKLFLLYLLFILKHAGKIS